MLVVVEVEVVTCGPATEEEGENSQSGVDVV